jgi:hypothetical protein
MKVVFLAACSALCLSSAFASFDMMLMPSFTNRINRYDPANGVSLGGFNANSARLITIDQAQGRAFVYDSANSRIRGYNYNSGESFGVSASISGVTSLDYHAGSNRVFALNSGGLFFATPGSGALNSFVTLGSGTTWQTTVVSGNVITAFGNSGTGNIVYESYNCTTGASVGSGSTTGIVLASTAIGKPTFFASPNAPNGFYAFTYVNLTGGVTVGRSSVNALGAAGLVTGFSLSGFASGTVMPSAVPAHGGFFLVGQSATTATDTLVRKMDNASTFTAEYTNTISGTTFTAGPYQAANVVAPEPGSMIALGLGVAALVRKRRNRV